MIIFVKNKKTNMKIYYKIVEGIYYFLWDIFYSIKSITHNVSLYISEITYED